MASDSGTRDAIRLDQLVTRRKLHAICPRSRIICNRTLWRVVTAGFKVHAAQAAGRDDMAAVRRIVPNRCCGMVIDFQDFFLAQVDTRLALRLKTNTANLLRLLSYFQIPVVATLERPLRVKGGAPKEMAEHLGGRARIFEKDFFDLCKERTIRRHLASLKRDQIIVAGCETDVCVLQSCLGLIGLGYEVYAIEELLFSSAHNVDAAIARMQAANITFLTYKTLYYELLEAVEGRHTEKMIKAFGAFPDNLPDSAE